MTWGPPLYSLADKPRTLSASTLQRLRRDIVSGRLPPGSKLRIAELAERYGAGASPLREALSQLVGDGLVRVIGQRGFSVPDLSLAELNDIADWRAKLECEALALSMKNRSVAWEADVVAAHYRLTNIKDDDGDCEDSFGDLWERRHWAFHFALYKACGSVWLLRFCETLAEQGERYRRAFVTYDAIDPRIEKEHDEILKAVLADRPDDAVATLKTHIGRAADLAKANLTLQMDERANAQ